MDTFGKRERERKKQRRKQEKAARKKERAEEKKRRMDAGESPLEDYPFPEEPEGDNPTPD